MSIIIEYKKVICRLKVTVTNYFKNAYPLGQHLKIISLQKGLEN